MTFRQKVNIITLGLVVLVLVLTRHELVTAWNTLSQVNLLIFLLVIPAQFLSYYAAGATTFVYLRAKGDLQQTSGLEAAKMALELNFVNHILPTGGVSGASYMTWRLAKLGVSTGRATLAQVVRFASLFGSYAALLVLAVLIVTIDGSVNRFIILVSSSLVSIIVIGAIVVGFVIGSQKRLNAFSVWIHKFVNGVWRKVFRQKRAVLPLEPIRRFFTDLHEDYLSLRQEPKQLKRPLMWGFVYNLAEVAMFFVTFLALGVLVDPALIFIALGLAGLVGIFMPTPGGAGGYEAAMILFLTTAGLNPGVAVAGILLARVLLVLLTIVTGYLLYHRALVQYGRRPAE